MRYEPKFYPNYYELAVAIGLLMLAVVALWLLYKFVTITNEYNRLRAMPIFDLYIEMTRCFSAIKVCASKDNTAGANYASLKVWLISLALQRGDYNRMDKALADSYFENYLALFQAMDSSSEAVAYTKQWNDRWSRKPISAPVQGQQ